MKQIINYDELYQKTFEKEYEVLANKVLKNFTEESNKTIFFRRNILINEIEADCDAMTMKKITTSNYHPDKYTEKLLREFDYRLNDYNTDKITNFIIDHLDKIKREFKNTEHNVPANIKLNAKQTVEFIAKHHAFKKFIKHLYNIDGDETMEIIEKKLSVEGYINPAFQLGGLTDENSDIEESKLEKINWLGNQKQLGELFVELKKKGWISEINPKLIRSYFTKTNTIVQILKPGEVNKVTKEFSYDGIYAGKFADSYKKKFDGIKSK